MEREETRPILIQPTDFELVEIPSSQQERNFFFKNNPTAKVVGYFPDGTYYHFPKWVYSELNQGIYILNIVFYLLSFDMVHRGHDNEHYPHALYIIKE